MFGTPYLPHKPVLPLFIYHECEQDCASRVYNSLPTNKTTTNL